VDPAHHILGERLNFWVASLLTLTGIAWFAYTQRSPRGLPPGLPSPATGMGQTGSRSSSRA